MEANRQKQLRTAKVKYDLDMFMNYFEKEKKTWKGTVSYQTYDGKLNQVNDLLQTAEGLKMDVGRYAQFFNLIIRNWLEDVVKPYFGSSNAAMSVSGKC